MKKRYIIPTVEMLILEQEDNLLAGSPGYYDEYSGNAGYSRSLEDFADDADELSRQMNNLFFASE